MFSDLGFAQTVGQPLAVGGAVSAPVFLPQPMSSQVLQQPVQHGIATVALVIDQEGFVSRTRLLRSSGAPDVDSKALANAQAFRFTPSTRAGLPVAVAVTMDVPATVGEGELPEPPKKPIPDPKVIRPKIIRQVDPEFPARRPGCPMSTEVEVRLVVNRQGLPKHLTIHTASQLDGYDTEAIRAVEKYRFAPATRDGISIEYPMLVDVGFSCF